MAIYNNASEAIRAGCRDFLWALHVDDIESVHTDEEYEAFGGWLLDDNTTYVGLNNMDILQNGLVLETSVSDDSELQPGSAIISKMNLKLKLENNDLKDFYFIGKYIEVRMAVRYYGYSSTDIRRTQYEDIGRFLCVDSKKNFMSDIISLTCYDEMYLLDQITDFETNNLYTDNISMNALSKAGLYNANYSNLKRGSILVKRNVANGKITNRDLVRWCAEISNTYAQIVWKSRVGSYVEYKDISTIAAADYAYKLNAGTITESSVTTIPIIKDIFSLDSSPNKCVYDGVQIKYDDGSSTAYSENVSNNPNVMAYQISDNNLISAENINTIANNFRSSSGGEISPKSYYSVSASVLGNPLLKAGTPAIIKNSDGVYRAIIITRSTFTLGQTQKIVSAAGRPIDTQTIRQSNVEKKIDTAISNSNRKIESSPGMYFSVGSSIYYVHDQPILTKSTNVLKFQSGAIYMSKDGGSTYTKIM